MPRDLIKCYSTFTKLYMIGSISAFILSTNHIKCHYWFYRSYKIVPCFIISKCNIDIKACQLIRQFNINSNNDYFTYKTVKNGNLYRRKRDNIFRNIFNLKLNFDKNGEFAIEKFANFANYKRHTNAWRKKNENFIYVKKSFYMYGFLFIWINIEEHLKLPYSHEYLLVQNIYIINKTNRIIYFQNAYWFVPY